MMTSENAPVQKDIWIHKDREFNDIDEDGDRETEAVELVPERTLTPVSQSAMNGLNIYVPRSSPPPISKPHHSASIHSISAATSHIEASALPGRHAPQYPPPSIPRQQQHHLHNHISASHNSHTIPNSPPTRKLTASQTMGSLSRNISSEFGPTTRSLSSNNLHHAGAGGLSTVSSSPPMSSITSMNYHDSYQHDAPHTHTASGENGPAGTGHGHLPSTTGLQRTDSTASVANHTSPAVPGASPASSNGTTGWSSAIGRANLGKSGRVIERLMGENDMLKRDVQIERLRAEESKQAVKLVEGKMDAVIGDYETKLHDAAVNKTLLKRRERQVQDLKSQIEGERKKAEKAEESEKGWRTEVDRVQREWGERVERAVEREKLMDGRNSVMASHWGDTRKEVEGRIEVMRGEIGDVERKRREDDEKFERLENVCRQQGEQLERIQREKDDIMGQFEEYKRVEAEALRDIKEGARRREQEQEKTLVETKRVLGELRWAMQIKESLRDER